jgi:molybdenum cofactor cytidylyltransferase
MTAPQHYVGILLAAGLGARFRASTPQLPQAHKLLATLPDGRTVAQASAITLLSAVSTTYAVVTDTPAELPVILKQHGCHIIPAPTAPRGMGISLAIAATYLLENVIQATPITGCVVALADMPCVRPDTITALLRHAANDRIVVPTFHGKRGHPVVFGRAFLAELSKLEGDTGARSLLLRYGALEIECDDAGVLYDIDTPEDLNKTTRKL